MNYVLNSISNENLLKYVNPPCPIFEASELRLSQSRLEWLMWFKASRVCLVSILAKRMQGYDQEYNITAYFVSSSPFTYGSYSYKPNKERGEPSMNGTSSSYTKNEKTVYYATYGVSCDMDDYPFTIVNEHFPIRSNNISEFAWQVLYGDVVPEGMDIPVNWVSTYGQSILTDTFRIKFSDESDKSSGSDEKETPEGEATA